MSTIALHQPEIPSKNHNDLTDEQICPSMVDGPIATAATALIRASQALGTSQWAFVLRAMSVPYVFAGKEKVFASGQDPVIGINALLHDLANFFQSAKQFNFPGPIVPDAEITPLANTISEVEQTTGNHYGNLFKEFSPSSFWEEPLKLLKTRLERNDIPVASIQGKDVIDAGCGGGRYAYAWRALGAKRVVGIDISTIGLQNAQQRGVDAGVTGMEFTEGNVLAIPFADNSFDVAFSNGILHHTVDWKQGVSELVRVLKPGGLGWLYLIENPGGLFWDLVEVLRVVTKGVSREVARNTLHMLGVPRNRIFYMLDHVMVPINLRLTSEEIESALSEAGAKDIRRLTRGADFDRVERIYQNDPYAVVKFGAGENRHVFTK
jgi:ubiquinone/menaquinone biosynthesis C-methylase UbiE